MSRLHKIFWLILIIIGIGAVAVATRTPARFSRTAASEPPAEAAAPDPLVEETPASMADDSLEDDTAEDSAAAEPAVDDGLAGSQNSSQ